MVCQHIAENIGWWRRGLREIGRNFLILLIFIFWVLEILPQELPHNCLVGVFFYCRCRLIGTPIIAVFRGRYQVRFFWLPLISESRAGCAAKSCNNTLAAPLGLRLPVSRAAMVWGDTCISSASSFCVVVCNGCLCGSLMRWRMAWMSAGVMLGFPAFGRAMLCILQNQGRQTR